MPVPRGEEGPVQWLRLGTLPRHWRGCNARARFYEGELVRKVARDMQEAGGFLTRPIRRLSRTDRTGVAILSRCRGFGRTWPHGGPDARTAAATLTDELRAYGTTPDGGLCDLCDGTDRVHRERPTTLGDDLKRAGAACTTHLSVVDRTGNMVALTQTLLARFGRS
jgi:gamma-glutamyltranspeptidase/glutathione hydrolase